MLLEVSIGEAVDKYSILEIKKHKIQNIEKLKNVFTELNILHECKNYIVKYPFLYSLLVHVNTVIWDTTDQIKELSHVAEPELFAQLAYKIFEYNQMRFRLKNNFNILTSSNIREQKSYAEDMLYINIDSCDTVYKKIPEINYLLIKYDHITFICNADTEQVIKPLFKNINYSFKSSIDGVNCKNITVTELATFTCNDDNMAKYDFPPITYASGGLLGDFIHQLSVIHQNYLQTGRRGVLYIANIADRFRKGIDQTYADTFDIISKQSYIKEYKIHNGEQVDVNLSVWRADPMLFRCNWHDLYKKVYSVDWGTKPWLKMDDIMPSPTGTFNRSDWQTKVVINTSKFRYPTKINFTELLAKYGAEHIIYIGFEEKEYNRFVNCSGINTIKFHKLSSLVEMCHIINSCALMVGSLSAPMAFATAMHKEMLISCPTGDIIMFTNLNTVIKSITLIHN
jgi:hypothetical protein